MKHTPLSLGEGGEGIREGGDTGGNCVIKPNKSQRPIGKTDTDTSDHKTTHVKNLCLKVFN